MREPTASTPLTEGGQAPARRTAIKFCGLTRSVDAAAAVRFGAGYLGVIFAGGPRRLTATRAAEVLAAAEGSCARVGVFGAVPPEEIAAVAAAVALDVVQLHGDPTPADVESVRRAFAGEVWAVVRTAGASLPAETAALFLAADAVVLDARVAGALGGTGVALDWSALAAAVARARGHRRLVLAGGLTADNVASAARILTPDVVDVSSGVEQAPGVKDHGRMARFAAAAR